MLYLSSRIAVPAAPTQKKRGFRPNLTGSSGRLVNESCVGETTQSGSKGDIHDDIDERCLAIYQRETCKCRCSIICYRDPRRWCNASLYRISRARAALVCHADVSVCRGTLYDASPSHSCWRVAVRGRGGSAIGLRGCRAECYPLDALIGNRN